MLPSRITDRVSQGVSRGKTRHLQKFGNPAGDPSRLPFFEARNDCDIFEHRIMGKKSDVLDDVSDVPPQSVGGKLPGIPAPDMDRSRVGLEEPVDKAQRRRFAAAGRPEKHAEFTLPDIEIKVP